MNQKLTPFDGPLADLGTLANANGVPSRTWFNTMHLRARWLLIALICCLSISMAQAQISVTVTNGTNTTPNLSASYASLAAALTDLNAVTAMSGPVTLTLSGSETAPVKGFVLGSATLNPVLSATNTITLINSGTVTINAGVGTSNGPTASPDGMFILNGADHVTIDGITFTDGNTTNATVTMEFGLAMFKRTAGDGCNNNTIQNCTFNMQRINVTSGTAPLVDGSVSIGVYNSTFAAATTALTPTNGGTLATNGTNSGNRFYTNTINGGNNGIAIIGFAATVGVGPTPNAATFLGDLSNDIGGSSSGTGNIVRNYGGGTSAAVPAAGIRGNNQWSINISYNTVNNNNGSGVNHPNTLRGINAQAGTSASATIHNNTVTVNGGGTTSLVIAIDNGIGVTAASNTISIRNNTIQNCTYPTGTTGTFQAINNSASAANVFIRGNQILNNTYTGATTTGVWTGIANTGTNIVNIDSNTIDGLTLAGTSTTSAGISVGSPTGAGCSANNNMVTNITRTSATTGTQRGIVMTSPTNNMTFNNNTVSNISFSNAASTGSIDGIYGLSSATNITINGNTITGLSVPTSGTINGIREFGSTGTKIIQNNQINNFTTTSGGVGGGTFNGISVSAGSLTISSNTIHTLNSTGTSGGTGGSIAGIIISGGTTSNIFKNKIYGLNTNSTSSTTTVVTGILASGGTSVSIFNNMVGALTAPAAGFSDAIRGIAITSTTTSTEYFVSFNTVNVSASSSATNFGTSGIFHTASITATTGALNLRNNIIVNTSTPNGTGLTVAYRRGGRNSLANYSATSNRNLFYAGTPGSANLIYVDSTNSVQTMSAYKAGVFSSGTVSPRDEASFSENVSFQSTTGSSADFLKIDLSIATQIESGGTPIAGITDDFFGTTRNTTSPDVGAFEGNLTGLDLTPPAISYTALLNTANTGNRTLSAAISDPSGVPTTGTGLPVLYWNINNGTYNSVTGVHQSGNTYTFNFGDGTVADDVVRYYIVAQDAAATPNVGAFPSTGAGSFSASPPSAGTPPTAPSSYTIVPAFSGTYSIGAGETYTSLTDSVGGFFRALNEGAATGNIILSITSNITETGQNALNQIADDGNAYTLTIRPAASVTPTLSGSRAGGLIRLNGADNVTIDGSNSGGTNRSLTINNTSTAAGATGIQLISLGTGSGATNNQIRNCNIATGSITVTTYGVAIGGATVGTSGADNDNNTIQNNNITNTAIGIYAVGTANVSTGGIDNVEVIGNNINTGIAAVAAFGIRMGNAQNASIRENTIDVRQSTSNAPVGISAESGFLNSTISRNHIVRSQYTGTAGYGGRGIVVGTGSATSNVTVVNNAVSQVSGDNFSSFGGSSSFGIGIGVDGNTSTLTTTTGGVNLYHNSVHMSGTFSRTTSVITTALYIGSGSTSLNIRNNIFVNSMSNTGTSGNSNYGIFSAASNTAFSAIDYNDYFGVTNTNNTFHVGNIGATNRTTLANWITASAGDANSINADPGFQSATDLRPILGSPVLGVGAPIGTVTTDFAGNTRSATAPAIGAFENGIDALGPQITYTALGNISTFTARTLTASISDVSGVPTAGAGLPVLYWRVNDGSWSSATGAHVSGNNYEFSFGAGVSLADTIRYYIVAQDLVSTPNVSAFPAAGAAGFSASPPAVATPPTTPSSYVIVGPPLAGSYNIGIGGDFTTLTAAAAAFNARGVSAHVTFLLTDATYTESATVTFSGMSSEPTSSSKILTIKPATGVTSTITSSSTGVAISITSSFVTFDGSNANNGTTRDVTIVNSATGANAGGVFASGSDVTISHLIARASAVTSGYGIVASAGNNIAIRNCATSRAVLGIQSQGNATNVTIAGCEIGTASEAIQTIGISILSTNGFTIEENTIRNVTRSGTAAVSGITIGQTTGGILPANGVIRRNLVFSISNTGTGSSAYGAYGIRLLTNNETANILVSNNVIYDIFGFGDGSTGGISWTPHGIYVENGGGYQIYYNSVHLTGALTYASTSDIRSGALTIGSATSIVGLDIRNNVLSNTQTFASATGVKAAHAIYSGRPNTSFTQINNNNYFVSGADGVLGFLTSNQTNITNWRTATSQDANSLNANPLYNSATNLRPQPSSPLLGAGTVISGITTDFLGTARSTTAPSIGAYEDVFGNTWTGTGEWTTAGNWSMGLPSVGDNVIIGSGTVEATSAGNTINSITVNSGATVTIPNGASLTVNGALTNNGTFTVQNGGHLLQGASASIGGSGTFNATRNSGNTSNLVYNMWSSPNSTSTLSNLGGTDWYFFNETSQAWSNTGLTGSSVMSAGRGYSSTGAGNVTFTGTFNNGAVTPAVGTSGQGWNLVGNPYPSSVSGTSFLAGNTNIDGTLWFWSQPTAATVGNSGGDYATWTTLGGTAGTAGGATPDGNIGLAQGFFVKANSGTTVSFTNSMRSANAGSNFRLAGERAWFNLTGSNNLFNQILLGFSNGASDQRDAADATKLKGNTQIAFYSLLGADHLAIQAMAERGTATRIVPVGFDVATAGAYSLALDRTESMAANVDIFLKDNLTGNMHNLRNQAYGFAVTNAGSFTNRFEIHFGVGLATSVNSLTAENVRIFGAGQSLFVQGFAEGTVVERFEVRDAAGRLVMELNRPQNADLERMEMNVAAGVYLARIVTNNGIKTERVYLSK